MYGFSLVLNVPFVSYKHGYKDDKDNNGCQELTAWNYNVLIKTYNKEVNHRKNDMKIKDGKDGKYGKKLYQGWDNKRESFSS